MAKTTPETEIQVIQRLINNDAVAFRALYEQYQGKLFLFAFSLIKSKIEAEEIVQEVFIRIWEKRNTLNPDKSFKAYLLTITKNLVFDKLKKAARDRALQEKIYKNIQQLEKIGANELLEKELQRLHQQAIERLSPRKKTIFLMSREEELTYEQIAQKLGISVHTVRNQMTDSLTTIREFLSNHPDIACLIIASLSSLKNI